jgi:hypothetical protein
MTTYQIPGCGTQCLYFVAIMPIAFLTITNVAEPVMMADRAIVHQAP